MTIIKEWKTLTRYQYILQGYSLRPPSLEIIKTIQIWIKFSFVCLSVLWYLWLYVRLPITNIEWNTISFIFSYGVLDPTFIHLLSAVLKNVEKTYKLLKVILYNPSFILDSNYFYSRLKIVLGVPSPSSSPSLIYRLIWHFTSSHPKDRVK